MNCSFDCNLHKLEAQPAAEVAVGTACGLTFAVAVGAAGMPKLPYMLVLLFLIFLSSLECEFASLH